MKISIKSNVKRYSSKEVVCLGYFQISKKEKLPLPLWMNKIVKNINQKEPFTGKLGESLTILDENSVQYLLCGLGEKKSFTTEKARREFSNIFKALYKKYTAVSIDLSPLFDLEDSDKYFEAIIEGILLSNYKFDLYKKSSSEIAVKEISFETTKEMFDLSHLDQIVKRVEVITRAANQSRDFCNEPPNILHSVEFAKRVEVDAKKIKGVTVKVLNKKDIQKERMGLFLAVNQASAYEPRLVHLTYKPTKLTKETPHIVLVGKGLTFDTGGYCLKPSTSINNMKGDMAGAATMYAAFKAASELKVNAKITCLLGMTDNTIAENAILPDAIVKARNGLTVEMINTDAEGRLVLADLLDYACDLKPSAIIDAATLTGACLVALGHEVCGLMGNSDELNSALVQHASNNDERLWQLPLFEEYKDDMKAQTIADLRNSATNRYGGTMKAAAFLECFIKGDVPWAHLDIAGIAHAQNHLPYCPKHGPTGLMVRTLVDYIEHA